MYINKLYITCTEVYFKSNYLFFGVVSKYSWLAVQEIPVNILVTDYTLQ
jgi:hypothetical protein